MLMLLDQVSRFGQFVAGLRGGRVHAHAARPSKQI